MSENLLQIEPTIEGSVDSIQQKLAEERIRLMQEAGLEDKEVDHFKKPPENPFTADQRDHTTLLFGGLTWKHEHLLHGAFEGLGYKCDYIPSPNVDAFQTGKEYGNNGQCNPTYFTVGSLVQHLQGLEEAGMSKEDIINNHVFLTAGACGPCRFGMYEAEYRLALKNAGFDGFRVNLFQQSGGIDQAETEAGLDMNLDFFMSILNALNIGDMVTAMGYLTRPYEIHEGETDRVVEESIDYLHDIMKDKKRFQIEESKWAWLLKYLPNANFVGKFLDQLFGDDYVNALSRVREKFDAIEVDRTRVKPIVKITGEFWAQTTEGDGNFNMFRFLEREGAEVLVEPIGTWIVYMIHQAKQANQDRKGVKEGEVFTSWSNPLKRLSQELKFRKKIGAMTMAERIFIRDYNRLREATGGTVHELADQYELQRLGHPFYNSRAGGGEGHLEVAKNIYYSNKDLAHMVLSLKPFGCMPSTQSDGAQAAVVDQYKDMIYLPVETSGEGEINAHSRVQMALGEAKMKTKTEFAETLAEAGLTADQVRDYIEVHPEIKKPTYHIPEYKGKISMAARTVVYIAEKIKAQGGMMSEAAG
ncbi:MAG: activator of (R)-2-hydroxyglutaryl-CoA dehydratase [Gemmatimonadota bacterium]|nr:activator of (R)-2-hydroxyglutaryl-CoA dehydratase [Gemmatimonadota bacterium]